MIFTCLTDSAELYASRLEELTAEAGAFSAEDALYSSARYLDGIASRPLPRTDLSRPQGAAQL